MKLFYLFICLFLSLGNYASNDELSGDTLFTTEQEYDKQFSLAKYFIEIDLTKARTEIDKIDFNQMSFIDSNDFKIAERKLDFYSDHFTNHDALIELEKLKKIAANNDDSLFYANTSNRIVEIYLEQSRFEEALQIISEIESVYTNRKMNNKVGELLLKKGAAQYSLGDYINSIETVFNAADKFRETDSKIHLAFSYLQVGITYLYIEEYNKAINNYELAQVQFLSSGDTLGAAVCNLNIGIVYLETEKFDTALTIYRAAAKTINKSNRQIIISQMNHNIGNSFLGLEQYDSAKYYFQKALKIDHKIGSDIGIATNYAMLSSLFKSTMNSDSAIFYGEKSLKIIKPYHDDDIESIVTKILGDCYYDSEVYAKSAFYFNWNIQVNDSIQKEKLILDKIANDRHRKIDDYREKLFSAKQRAQLNEQENRIQRQLIIGMSIFGLIMIGLLVLVSTINRKNKKLNNELIENQKITENNLNIKNSLLKEIHHRVKNNLQVISSMLSIQNQYITDPKLNLVIEECKSRINSMALIHESLYKRDTNDVTSFNTYIKNLIPKLIQTYHVDESRVKLKMEVIDINLSIDESIPCGLLINEIISNSLKHAFPDEKNGEISIKMHQENEIIHLKISDNGIGLPGKIKPSDQDTFGFLLIYTLASQLDAKMEVKNENGLTFNFSWEMKNYQMLS